MIIEALAEVILPTISRFFSYIAFDIIGHIFGYPVGFIFLRAITFGKYPKEYVTWSNSEHRSICVSLTGILILFIPIVLLVSNASFAA